MRRVVLLLVILFAFSFVNAATYGDGTYGAGLYGIGEEAASETPATPSGGGGGGCDYNWTCTSWFPSECSVEGVQERLCVNYGSCTGTIGMPEQTRTCVYEHKEPLFDIFLTIPAESREVCGGQKITANIDLQNYGKLELLDAFMTYWIVDENNKLVSEQRDTRSVAEKINFDISMRIPLQAISGTYKLYAEITYSGNKTALAGESFEILDEQECKFAFDIYQYLPFIAIALVFFVLFIIVLIIIERLHHHKKKLRKMKKIVRKVYVQSKPEKLGFFRRLELRRQRIKREEARIRLVNELIRQKRIAEKRNRKLRKKKMKENAKQEIMKQKLSKQRRKEYKRKIKEDKKRERKTKKLQMRRQVEYYGKMKGQTKNERKNFSMVRNRKKQHEKELNRRRKIEERIQRKMQKKFARERFWKSLKLKKRKEEKNVVKHEQEMVVHKEKLIHHDVKKRASHFVNKSEIVKPVLSPSLRKKKKKLEHKYRQEMLRQIRGLK